MGGSGARRGRAAPHGDARGPRGWARGRALRWRHPGRGVDREPLTGRTCAGDHSTEVALWSSLAPAAAPAIQVAEAPQYWASEGRWVFTMHTCTPAPGAGLR